MASGATALKPPRRLPWQRICGAFAAGLDLLWNHLVRSIACRLFALTEESTTLRESLPESISKRMPMLLPAGFIAISVVVHLIVGAIGDMLGVMIFSPRKAE